MKSRNLIFLTVLSGKGGSGKTVLSLSFAKVLSEIGLKVLFVDLDTATHGSGGPQPAAHFRRMGGLRGRSAQCRRCVQDLVLESSRHPSPGYHAGCGSADIATHRRSRSQQGPGLLHPGQTGQPG